MIVYFGRSLLKMLWKLLSKNSKQKKSTRTESIFMYCYRQDIKFVKVSVLTSFLLVAHWASPHVNHQIHRIYFSSSCPPWMHPWPQCWGWSRRYQILPRGGRGKWREPAFVCYNISQVLLGFQMCFIFLILWKFIFSSPFSREIKRNLTTDRLEQTIFKPWHQTLSPKPFSPKFKTKGPWADTKFLQATTTTTHP